MDTLITSVMCWAAYPEQDKPWCGYEYIPQNKEGLEALCKACNYDWWDGVEFGCLQYCPSTGRCVVCFDCNVWEVKEEEFIKILSKIKDA